MDVIRINSNIPITFKLNLQNVKFTLYIRIIYYVSIHSTKNQRTVQIRLVGEESVHKSYQSKILLKFFLLFFPNRNSFPKSTNSVFLGLISSLQELTDIVTEVTIPSRAI